MTSAAIELFYSYAHADETLRNELNEHLSLLKRQGLISEWHDREITAGTLWAKEIDTHLQTAHVILLLISPAFIASDYCYGIELQAAIGKGPAMVPRQRPTSWVAPQQEYPLIRPRQVGS